MTDQVSAELTGVTRVEIGCGANKREGFFGIDVAPGPAVDLVLDVEQQSLPFADNSVEYIYSSHTFEHLVAPGSPIQTLREIMRVVKHGGLVEIWTPFGRSDDGLLFGHGVFYTDTHWKHICYLHDDFYLGEGTLGRFNWARTQYVLSYNILDRLDRLGLPIDFALGCMQNIALEFGVFLEVDKTRIKAVSPQEPVRELCYARGAVLRQLTPSSPDELAPLSLLSGRGLRQRISSSPAGPVLRKLREPFRKDSPRNGS